MKAFSVFRLAIVAPLVAALLMTACAGDSLIPPFRAAFAASKPFVQSLVTSGTITQEKADAATADIQSGVDIFDHGATCVNGITATGRAKTVAKAQCYYNSAQEVRTVLDRHNIQGAPFLDRVSEVAQGAILAFETYYASVTSKQPSTAAAGDSTAPVKAVNRDKEAENELNDKLKELTKELKELRP